MVRGCLQKSRIAAREGQYVLFRGAFLVLARGLHGWAKRAQTGSTDGSSGDADSRKVKGRNPRWMARRLHFFRRMARTWSIAGFSLVVSLGVLAACGGQVGESGPSGSQSGAAGSAASGGSGGGGTGKSGASGADNDGCPGVDIPSTVTRCIQGKFVETSCCAGPSNDSCMPDYPKDCGGGTCVSHDETCGDSCGSDPPQNGEPCSPGAVCSWGDLVGVCDEGGWFTGSKATGGAFSSGTPCNPVGRWHLVYGPPESSVSSWCTEPSEFDLEIRTSPEGWLIAQFGGGTVHISDDGCSISASSSQSFTNPSENWTSSTKITLLLQGDSGAGLYTKSNSGFCVGAEDGPLTASRKIP